MQERGPERRCRKRRGWQHNLKYPGVGYEKKEVLDTMYETCLCTINVFIALMNKYKRNLSLLIR